MKTFYLVKAVKNHFAATTLLFLLLFTGMGFLPVYASDDSHPLTGTSWKIIQFEDRYSNISKPDIPENLTVSFEKDGLATMKLDCNRGKSSWSTSGKNKLRFAPAAMTRALCPPNPFRQQWEKNITEVRSYTMKNGFLLLSLRAGGGKYKLEKIGAENPLAGTNWRLVSFRSEDGKVITSDKVDLITVSFAKDGNVSMKLNCNNGRGKWYTNGSDQLTFGPIAATRKMCPADPLADQWTKDIQNVANYALKDGYLLLSLKNSGGIYKLALRQVSDQALAGTSWRIVKFEGADGKIVNAEDRDKLTLSFAKDGKVHMKLDCNNGAGKWSISENNGLKFESLVTTLAMCLPYPLREQWQRDIAKVDRYRITDNHLFLLLKDNSGTYELEKLPKN